MRPPRDGAPPGRPRPDRPPQDRGPRRRPGPRPGTPNAARRCALEVVHRVFEEGAFADKALHAEAARFELDGRDRALATHLAFGTVQRRRTLDHIAHALSSRPVDRLDPPVRSAVRLGLQQIVFTDGIPDHAAVSETVTLAKERAERATGFVNAVLRRATEEGRALVANLPEETAEQAALKHSVPDWIARLWWDAFGPEDARDLLAALNAPAEHAVRANALRTTPAALAAALADRGVTAREDAELPHALVLDGPYDAHGDDLFTRGLLVPQSRGSQVPALVLEPRPGERVLDLCAAPGGKTSQLAAAVGPEGEVVAVERHAGRAAALARTLTRLGADGIARVERRDASEPWPEAGARFDRVLVDPPCSGLGTLASRPDRRWRAREEDVAPLAALQDRILDVAADATRPGGTLVLSTCTLSPEENEGAVARFLARHDGWGLDDLRADHPAWQHPTAMGQLLLLPHRHRTDGFHVARLRREPA